MKSGKKVVSEENFLLGSARKHVSNKRKINAEPEDKK